MRVTDILLLTGGLALLLLGLRALREGLAAALGPVIARLIDTGGGIPRVGLIGFLASALLQSHSRAARAALGLAGASILPLSRTAGMMAGAQAGGAALPFLLFLRPEAGAVLAMAGIALLAFRRHMGLCGAGLALAGLGVAVMGMSLAGWSADVLGAMAVFGRMAQGLAFPLPGLLLGAGVTGAAGSAAIVAGILQLLASRGLIGADAAFYMMLGANIGKFVPVLLSSAGAPVSARRAAAASAIGGTATALLALAISQFLPVIPLAASAGGLWILLAHLAYNTASAALLLPFSGVLARLAHSLLPGEEGAGDTPVPGYDHRLLAVPALARKFLTSACCKMGRQAQAALDTAAHAYLYGVPAEPAVLPGLPAAALEDALEYAGRPGVCAAGVSTGRLLRAVHAMERINRAALDLAEAAAGSGPRQILPAGRELRDAEEMLRSAGNILSCALDGLETGSVTPERLMSLRIDSEAADGLLRRLRKEYAAHAAGNRHPRRYAAYLSLMQRLAGAADDAMEIALAAAATRDQPVI